MYLCILVNLSVITRIALNPSDSGNSPTKSIAISSHGCTPVGIGSIAFALLCLSALARRHLSQPAT